MRAACLCRWHSHEGMSKSGVSNDTVIKRKRLMDAMPLAPRPTEYRFNADELPLSPEKRRCARIRVDWRALVLRPGVAPLPVRVCDVAACGLRLESAQDFPLGAVLQLAVYMPVGEVEHALSLRARVCYQVYGADRIQAGLRFVDHTGARSLQACCSRA